MLLEQAEAKLEAERTQRQNIVDYYKKFLAKSDASKKKHDTAVEEYHKYQLEQLQTRIRQLESAAAAARKETESSADSDDEEEEEEDVEPPKHRKLEKEPEDVVDLDSDDE